MTVFLLTCNNCAAAIIKCFSSTASVACRFVGLYLVSFDLFVSDCMLMFSELSESSANDVFSRTSFAHQFL